MFFLVLASLCLCDRDKSTRPAEFSTSEKESVIPTDGGKEAIEETPMPKFDEELRTMMKLYDKVVDMLQVTNLEGDEFFMFSSLEPKTAVLWRDVTPRDPEYVDPEKDMLSALKRGYT